MARTVAAGSPAYDPSDPKVVRDPYPALLALQADDPAHWSPRLKAWVLTRYPDVKTCLSGSQMSVDRIQPFYATLPPAAQSQVAELMRYLTLWLVFRDPPEHTRLRHLMARAFTMKAVETLRGSVEDIFDLLADSLPRAEAFDFVEDFAMQLPAFVIMDLLGVPRDYMFMLKSCSDRMQLFIGSARNAPDKYERAEAGAREMAALFRTLIAERRAAPCDDLISALIAARDDDDSLTEDEMVAACMLVMFGGHETTTNLLAGGMAKFLLHPEAAEALAADGGLAKSAVEECLRLDGPSASMARVVAQDHQLHGRTLRAGERVFAMINAANQDPEVFEEPHRFDITRRPNKHLTFGYGAHFCMGAALARLEGEVAFPRLVQRFPTMRAASPMDWHTTMIMRGPRVMPVIIG
ncbi:MAG: cytochrome P450 [Alkalilacustris sp.]